MVFNEFDEYIRKYFPELPLEEYTIPFDLLLKFENQFFKSREPTMSLLQDIVRDMENHLGYKNHKSLVFFEHNYSDGFSNLTKGPRKAGLIMRDGSNFSEITVYYNYEYEVKNYLAVLAHELSHAYQIAKGRPTYIKEEYNEYFTDALIVYLGFGKMYLDGMQKVEKDFKISTLTYSSKKLKLGYLSKRNITTLIQYRERLLSEKKNLNIKKSRQN